MNIDELTIGEAKVIAEMFGNNNTTLQPYKIGQTYMFRTVTHIIVGVVEDVGDKEIVLSEASWIPDTGRYHNFIKDGTLEEVEPYIDKVIIGRGALVDSTVWRHGTPKEQK
tara:strand:+ start:229 stop:561 length:333 start_codon:yes stop_codon:yes gene_type:complete